MSRVGVGEALPRHGPGPGCERPAVTCDGHASSPSRLGPGLRRDSDFADAAVRLAGLAGVAFGWSADAFWRATPAELEALVRVIVGEDVTPPDAGLVARLREAFPDG